MAVHIFIPLASLVAVICLIARHHKEECHKDAVGGDGKVLKAEALDAPVLSVHY